MPFPGNAASVPVKAIHFPTSQLHAGPGYFAAKNLRPYHGGKKPDFILEYYPVLRHFKVTHLDATGAPKETGWVWEGHVEYWEQLEE